MFAAVGAIAWQKARLSRRVTAEEKEKPEEKRAGEGVAAVSRLVLLFLWAASLLYAIIIRYSYLC